jgi:hypothetical protein
MEKIKLATQTKTKSNSTMTTLRISKETKKRLQSELAKANKKDFGKRITADAILLAAVSNLTPDDITKLQDASLSNADRLEMRFKSFAKSNPGVSKDEFLGALLSARAMPEYENAT